LRQTSLSELVRSLAGLVWVSQKNVSTSARLLHALSELVQVTSAVTIWIQKDSVWTSPALMRTSPSLWHPNGNIWVRGYIRTLSPHLEGCPLHILKYTCNLQQKAPLNLSHTPLTHPWALERRLELILEWTPWVQSKNTLASSSTTSISFISLGDSSPRRLGVAWELPSVWLSPEKFVLPSSSWGLIVKSRTQFKWSFGED
jgi:hypothetical protein